LVSNINGEAYTEGIGNRMLRKIFGTKRDKIIGGWKKLHNEELHNLCFLCQIRMIRQGGCDGHGM
jgi:hypothetical protein